MKFYLDDSLIAVTLKLLDLPYGPRVDIPGVSLVWLLSQRGDQVKTPMTGSNRGVLVAAILLTVVAVVNAWEPNAADRDTAIKSGNYAPYMANLTTYLTPKVPSKIDKKTMSALLQDRAFMAALIERHFIAKVWGTALGDWSKADPKNQQFLSWLMAQPAVLDDMMVAVTPSAGYARADDSWNITRAMLEDIKKIYYADPASRSGLYLRLAVACAIRPPGSANRGAGEAKVQSSVFDRYMHYRKAHAAGELMPSFDRLTTWELTHVVSACVSNDDLAWGREALNTWKPDFRKNEGVVTMTSQVWYRGANGVPYNDMSLVMGAGGKCGPRSSFGVFINQAFGIPATGVGQPAHAAVAFRGPDGNWQIGYGRGWNVSKVFDRFKMSGDEFRERTAERSSGMFAAVEHLRWVAALVEAPAGCYLPPADRKYKNPRGQQIMDVGNQLTQVVRGGIDPLRFVKSPDKTFALTSFEAPTDWGDNYATRIRGFIHPPKTGEYVFRIASDEYSDLLLSTDADRDNRKVIARVPVYTLPREYGKSKEQTSQPIRLEAGKQYYIEALHAVGAGNDNLSVAWSSPGVAEGVIPGACLSPYTTSGARGSIVREVWDGSSSKPAAPASVAKAEAPIVVPPGVIHVEAENFFTHANVNVEDCYTGGKQVYYPALTAHAWCGYKINVPKTGTYKFSACVATVNWGQQIYVRSFGAMYPVKEAKASNVYRNQESLNAAKAIDNDLGTRWAMDFGKEDGWIELDLGQPREISKLIIDERALNYICRHRIEYKVGGEWKTLLEGELMKDYVKSFPPVTAQYVRLRTLECQAQTGGPTIREFSVGNVLDGNGFIVIPWAPALEQNKKGGMSGRWQMTKPLDMYLVKGTQNIFVSTQTLEAQRSVAIRYFQLTPSNN